MQRTKSGIREWAAVISVHRDDDVMQRNLLRSPAITYASDVMCQRDFRSVASAYNAAIRQSSSDVIVFLHPDVYLPDGWHAAFQRSLAWLEEHDPEWGVLGLYGCSQEGDGRGFVYSTGMSRFIGAPFFDPEPVRTVDEFVFIVRKSSGLEFDEALPGAQSQLCATDLCLQAERSGQGVYVLPCFALHNSNGWSYLPMRFWRPYLYMQKKWWSALPVKVPYTKITRNCTPMIRNSIRALRMGRGNSHRISSRHPSVAELYVQLQTAIASAFDLRRQPLDATDSAVVLEVETN